jgi:type II restriction/modification system DNA methylase subunit YeeA
MTKAAIQEFIKTWSRVEVNEIAAAQSHFNDICALVGHDTPLKADPEGNYFRFEQPTEKTGGTRGRADVWYDKKFILEYKGAHANLDKAYQQLLLYRESLGNPPILIASDLQRIIIHTNFTNTVKQVVEIDFDRLENGDGLNLLQRVFYDPESFRPTQTQTQVTQICADNFVKVAETLQNWAKAEKRYEDPERLAHFIIRLLFALFAEDMGLLPENVFTELVRHHKGNVKTFSEALKGLFAAMRSGGMFGYHRISYFDGGLFDDDYVPDLPGGILHFMQAACDQNWASIDPSIFGTLFERIIDEDKRAQLGAHYTSRDDIMLIVEPVLMQPLRQEWQSIKASATPPSHEKLSEFSGKIAKTRVLDPACGSGNFLYVALRQLLDLQKEVITYAGRNGLPVIPLTVSPEQLFGIEINPYAHELAQITVWIGYLQWRFENGFAEINEPILRPLKNIEHKDAILAYDENSQPVEPEWPSAEVIIGNPPFLGSHKLRSELGSDYVDTLFGLYKGRIPGAADLVCYWFEKARIIVESKKSRRVGLLATQGIRGGANRTVIDRIKNIGDIFLAWSDRKWILDGAMVQVSIVCFDDGQETTHILDGKKVLEINSDLSSVINTTTAKSLKENYNLVYKGIMKGGPFDIESKLARELLAYSNKSGKKNSDVVKKRLSAQEIVKRSQDSWIIDFGVGTTEEQAKQYEKPYDYIKKYVKPIRDKNRRKVRRERWWLFGETNPTLRKAIAHLSRCIVTPETTKHRVFVWMDTNIIPDYGIHIIVREDNYFFGVLQSKLHILWAKRVGTQLRDAGSGLRYTSTTTFETFPFPWPPGQEPSTKETSEVSETSEVLKENAIAEAARQLVALRQGWLHPPEEEIGITISQKMLKKRTLTNLYNALEYYRENVRGVAHNPRLWKDKFDYVELEMIETLDHIHTRLDQAVLDAYGWPHNLSDEQILEKLLALNLERAG